MIANAAIGIGFLACLSGALFVAEGLLDMAYRWQVAQYRKRTAAARPVIDHRPIGTCRDCGAEGVRVQQIRPHILLDHEDYCESCALEVMA